MAFDPLNPIDVAVFQAQATGKTPEQQKQIWANLLSSNQPPPEPAWQKYLPWAVGGLVLYMVMRRG